MLGVSTVSSATLARPVQAWRERACCIGRDGCPCQRIHSLLGEPHRVGVTACSAWVGLGAAAIRVSIRPATRSRPPSRSVTFPAVSFLTEPTERFYGIEATFLNSGNWFSMTQRTEGAGDQVNPKQITGGRIGAYLALADGFSAACNRALCCSYMLRPLSRKPCTSRSCSGCGASVRRRRAGRSRKARQRACALVASARPGRAADRRGRAAVVHTRSARVGRACASWRRWSDRFPPPAVQRHAAAFVQEVEAAQVAAIILGCFPTRRSVLDCPRGPGRG
jgi:hypothetical protein